MDKYTAEFEAIRARSNSVTPETHICVDCDKEFEFHDIDTYSFDVLRHGRLRQYTVIRCPYCGCENNWRT